MPPHTAGVGGGALMDTMLRDLRYGVRTLLKQPGFTLIAVLTLDLGISSTSVIFSCVDALMVRPRAFENCDRLVAVDDGGGGGGDFGGGRGAIAGERAQGAKCTLGLSGRQKSTVCAFEGQAEMQTIARRLEEQFPQTKAGRSVSAPLLRDAVMDD